MWNKPNVCHSLRRIDSNMSDEDLFHWLLSERTFTDTHEHPTPLDSPLAFSFDNDFFASKNNDNFDAICPDLLHSKKTSQRTLKKGIIPVRIFCILTTL